MKIVSVIPEALCEWETEIALGLACWGCDLACTYCHMQGLIRDESKIIGEAKDLFFKHINPMHTGVVISGGEPTLWQDSLFELLLIVKSAGLKTKVFSNGMNPEAIFVLNRYKLVDTYSFDVKAARDLATVTGTSISDEAYLENLYASIFNCKSLGVPLELRHTMAPGVDSESVRRLLSGHEVAGIPVHFQKCVTYKE